MPRQATTRRGFLELAAGACGVLAAPHNLSGVPTNRVRRPNRTSSYLDILRSPDSLTAYSGSKMSLPLTRSGDRWGSHDISVRTGLSPKDGSTELAIHLSSPQTHLTHLHLRWILKLPSDLRILGDAWERSYGDLEWRGFVPERPMPWYFFTFDGDRLNGYGVRTGVSSFCFWQVDPEGVSLWTDLRNGGNPVELGSRELHVASVVTRQAEEGEAPIDSSRLFCKRVCPDPRLPHGPLYGSNDWYYAYGKNTADGILHDADFIASIAPSHSHKPFVVIDDGWQDNRRFPDMAGIASAIRQRGLRPGLWVRPTSAQQDTIASLLLSSARFGKDSGNAATYDPTIPEALEKMLETVRRPVSWGYEFLKHDFSTYELLGKWGREMGSSPTCEGWNFADHTRTNAEIIISFYQALRRAAGNSVVMLGCNTIGHLSAGIFESQRTGDDTSGTSWERTRQMGVNTLAFRNPQHHTLFHLDPDCVAITDRIDWSNTRQWLDLVSRSGASLFISPQPEAIGPEQKAVVKDAFQIVGSSTSGFAEDWLNNTTPQQWRFQSTVDCIRKYQWCTTEGTLPFES